MKRARTVTVVLAVLVVVAALLSIPFAKVPRGEFVSLAGQTQGGLLLDLTLAAGLLLVGALVSAAVWSALHRSSRGRWGALALGLVAVLALLPVGYAVFAVGWGASLQGTVTRFEAPDGTPYLLRVETQESGMLAVYDAAGFGRWRLHASFGERYVLPGSPPCRPTATATEIIVRCSSGQPSTARR